MAEDQVEEVEHGGPMPDWIQGLVKEVLPNIEALFPVGTGWHEKEPGFFEVLFWPAMGERVVEGKKEPIYEDFVVHLMHIADLFDDDDVMDVQANTYSSLVVLEFTQPTKRTVVLRFQYMPPENLPPAYEALDDESWVRIRDGETIYDESLEPAPDPTLN